MIVSTFHRRARIPRFLGVAAALAVLSAAPRLHAQGPASVELDAAQTARVTCDADSGGITSLSGSVPWWWRTRGVSRGTSSSPPMATSTGRPGACDQLIAPDGQTVRTFVRYAK